MSINLKKWRRKLERKVIMAVAPALVNWLCKSLRFKVVGREQLEQFQGKTGFILNTWHGQQLVGYYFYRGCGYYILASRHRDGDYVSNILRRFGWKIVRGSSYQGAVSGLLGLLRGIRQGNGVVLTPDGPRGPIYHIEPGGIFLAQKSGAPLIPVAFVFDRKWVMKKTWDQYVIPKPFARCVAYFGEPLFVTEKLTDERLEVEKERLQTALHEANRRGEEVLKQWLAER
ncbi:MAG: lysophospholipid acyltransferase family protein [Firmicutes bacterium]|nr:lysophospholipid acyltransferase family protein [Bacillota bacterium]